MIYTGCWDSVKGDYDFSIEVKITEIKGQKIWDFGNQPLKTRWLFNTVPLKTGSTVFKNTKRKLHTIHFPFHTLFLQLYGTSFIVQVSKKLKIKEIKKRSKKSYYHSKCLINRLVCTVHSNNQQCLRDYFREYLWRKNYCNCCNYSKF